MTIQIFLVLSSATEARVQSTSNSHSNTLVEDNPPNNNDRKNLKSLKIHSGTVEHKTNFFNSILFNSNKDAMFCLIVVVVIVAQCSMLMCEWMCVCDVNKAEDSICQVKFHLNNSIRFFLSAFTFCCMRPFCCSFTQRSLRNYESQHNPWSEIFNSVALNVECVRDVAYITVKWLLTRCAHGRWRLSRAHT